MSEKRKREGDTGETEDIIQAVLREEQEAKKARKQGAPGVKDGADEGKTLGDIEEEEGGTIKESQVAMAHAKRTQKRKAKQGTREGVHLKNLRSSAVSTRAVLVRSCTILLFW